MWGDKSLIFSFPVLVVALILHFLTFVGIDGAAGWGTGFGAAIFLAVLSFFGTAGYTLLTKKPEKMLSGYFVFLSYSIIITILARVYMEFIQPALGL